jgi:hypothetical protein
MPSSQRRHAVRRVGVFIAKIAKIARSAKIAKIGTCGDRDYPHTAAGAIIEKQAGRATLFR